MSSIVQKFKSLGVLTSLLLLAGGSEAWGQTSGYSGVYYIGTAGYNANTPTNNYYLCPTEGWIYYEPDNKWSDDGTTYPNPFLTTYKCKTNDYHSGNPSTAVWYIEKHPTQDYYYIKHASDGKYVISNGQISGTSNANRMRVHLESVAPEDLDDKALFSIYPYSGYLVISPKSPAGWNGNFKWYTVNGGNKDYLVGNGSNGGPTNHTETGGIIGTYTENDANAKFYLENALSIVAPTITNNFDGTITITAAEDATIYYTTNGDTPTTSTLTTGTTSVTVNITESMTVIKAIAKASSDPFPTIVTTYEIPVCAKPAISVSGGTVTITCATAGAVIHYTTDGSPATSSSTTYSAPFAKGDASTIRAVATKAGYVISSEAILQPTIEVFSSDEITDMTGNYILAESFSASSTIGSPSNPFKGTIDGNYNEFSLSHALVDVADGATIKNIIVSSATISGSDNAGAIVNTAKGETKIYNCGVLSGSISGSGAVGGLVGYISETGTRVVNCYNYATVSGGTYAGGIVGRNNGTIGDTRIAMCMMYGNLSGGSVESSPVYAGTHVSNAGNFTEYNYWRSKADVSYSAYNDQLAIDKDDYLTRFPFYRHILNTHRELAAYFLFGDYNSEHVEEIGHWVLKKGDNAPIYPIVEAWRENTQKATVDIKDNLPSTTDDYKGKLLTEMGTNGYLRVNVTINGSLFSSDLPITDMDTLRYDYTWGKIVLPFANEYSGWTRDYDYVCTGWKITSITGGTAGSLSNYNFADRDCTAKDLYANSDYIFAQGGNYIVPYGVKAINIEANFARAYYLSDPSYEMGYNDSFNSATQLGGTVSDTYHGKTVYTNLSTLVGALSTSTNPHSQAIVLVGNYHYNTNLGGVGLNTGKAVTIMSTDEDNNQEPDYGWYTCNTTGRLEVPALRFDFVPNIEMGMSSRVGTNYYPAIGIWHARGWFELTETCVSQMFQCEINSSDFTNADNGKGNNRWIANSGIFTQIVRARDANCTKLSYIQIGGNAYVKELYPGSHTDNARTCAAVPILVTGGQVDECYMTGYNASAKLSGDMIYFWCAGGKIDKFLGAYLEEPLAAGITAKADHTLINRFFGGGTSSAARIKGDINVTINNSKVNFYCGGPEFGDMYEGKQVTTNANNTVFGEYYGAGFGGTSITYKREQQENAINIANNPTTTYPISFGTYYKRLTDNTSLGVGSSYKFEYIYHSNGSQGVARFYTGYAQFSLATTGNVTNTLTNCKMTKFYGAGCQGKVSGNVESTLTGCTVIEKAFGAGYKAVSNDVYVYTTTQPTYSVYKRETGIFSDFGTVEPEKWKWAQGTAATRVIDAEHKTIYTTNKITIADLGIVTGNVALTLNSTTVGSNADETLNKGNVFGGGEESSVKGNITVTINGGNIYGSVFGGGDIGSVGTFETNDDGKPISCAANTGKCTVEIKGAANIGHDGMTMPDDWGHIFGAGRGTVNPEEAARVGGHIDHVAYVDTTHVYIGVENGTIDASPLIKGSVYGGSENGHVLHGTYVEINSGQIGVGKNTTDRYTAEQWSGGSSLAPCASWTYEEDGYVYDPYAPEGGWGDDRPELQPGKRTATDGHTYYGNVFGGGSGVIPFDVGEWQRASGLVEGSTKVVINGGHILTSVYGGNEQTDVLGVTSVEMNGGTVGVPRSQSDIEANPALCYVFGGGKGDKRTKFNTWTNVKSTSVAIKGGTVYGSVYGGGEDGHVLRDAAMAVTPAESKTVRIGCGGTSGYDGNVFGGGQGSPVAQTAGVISGNVSVNVTGGTMWGSVYGGGRLASVGTYLVPATETPSETDKYGRLIPDGKEQVVTDDGSATDITAEGRTHGVITMTVTGGNIKGSVFGAGKGDRRTDFNTWTNVKSTSVTINGGTIEGSVFGGGEDGHVLRDVATLINPTESRTIVIGKEGAADSGNVFGAGKGSTTALTAGVVSGNVTLNIKGGTMWGSVYGGGRLAAVGTFLVPPTSEKYGTFIPQGKEQIVVNNGPGYEEDAEGRTHGNITVSLTGGTINGDVFGGGMGTQEEVEHADRLGISRNVWLNLNKGVETTGVKGCVVKGNIFGCNNMNTSPKGKVTVHVYATQNEAASQIANTAEVEDAKVLNRYDVLAVYGGGNMAAYVPDTLGTSTNVIIDGCDRTSIKQVYGGGNAASTPATSVTVNGTYEIEEVFGGGNGKDAIVIGGETKPNPGANVGFYDYSAVEDVYDTKEKRETEEFVSEYVYGTGAASVNIFGGKIHRVFGGSNTKGNVKTTAITLLDESGDCEFCVDEAYGGGKSAPMDAEAKLLMACIPGLQAVYGGAEAADVHGDVTLNITNGTFKRVFGGNNISGTIDGAIKVNIEEVGCRPIIIGELYGGGNKAAYSIYGYNDDGTPKTEGENPSADPQVNLKAFTSIGAVYGGGYGTTATMVGSPTVSINEVVGTPTTYPTSGTDGSIGGTFTATGYSGATGVEVDPETGHTVDIPAHVRGKIGAVGKVFGGGNAAPVMGSTTVNVGNLSTIDFESTTAVEAIPVKGADIKGNIYGGGDAAEVTDNASVNVGKKK